MDLGCINFIQPKLFRFGGTDEIEKKLLGYGSAAKPRLLLGN